MKNSYVIFTFLEQGLFVGRILGATGNFTPSPAASTALRAIGLSIIESSVDGISYFVHHRLAVIGCHLVMANSVSNKY